MPEVYTCKKHFGYTYVKTCDKKMQCVLFGYCEGRSVLWRMFFGWRKTSIVRGNEQMFFLIPSRKVDDLIEIARDD